jgi:hypothetical protein
MRGRAGRETWLPIGIKRPQKTHMIAAKPDATTLHKDEIHMISETTSRLPSYAVLALLLGTAPALAVEQCRFTAAKPEREACYQRQAAELAAKRKPEPPPESKTMQSLEQMKHEDEALNRQLHSICRGC